MESVTLQKSSVLEECREQVRAAQSALDVLVKRAESLVLQKAETERLVNDLETSRADIIAGIGRGTATDADLAKLKKELSRARDTLADTREILASTQAALKEAQHDYEKATAARKVEEGRAWRLASNDLIETHRAQIQALYDEVFVAVNLYQPGTIYWSLINGLGLRVPQEADFIAIKNRLAEQYHL